MAQTEQPTWQRARITQDVSEDWETRPSEIGKRIWVENRTPREGRLVASDGNWRWTRFLFTHEVCNGERVAVPITSIELLAEFTYAVVEECVQWPE